MIEGYRAFFAASVGASAAFIGLLFVALSFIDNEKSTEKVVTMRRIIANSSFAQLTNVFFVSLAGLLPGPRGFAVAGCTMAVFGFIAAMSLLPQTVDREHTGRGAPTTLGFIATGVYVLEFIVSIGLIRNPSNQTPMDFFILAIILLYAGALARAWEITGVKGR